MSDKMRWRVLLNPKGNKIDLIVEKLCCIRLNGCFNNAKGTRRRQPIRGVRDFEQNNLVLNCS